MYSILRVLLFIVLLIAAWTILGSVNVDTDISESVYRGDAQYLIDNFTADYQKIFKSLKELTYLTDNLLRALECVDLDYTLINAYQKVIFLSEVLLLHSILLIISGIILGIYLRCKYTSGFNSLFYLRVIAKVSCKALLLFKIILIFQSCFTSIPYLMVVCSLFFVSLGFRIALLR
ncbi:MAG: hypothetical protein ACI4UM_06790 [Succinivibrio sp.]